MQRSQSGNAILIVLIGVVLFGALAAMFLRGAKSGQGNLTDNQARIAAQEIINYSNLLEKTVDKLRSRGCSEGQINFQNNMVVTGYTNASAPSDSRCNVFLSNGGPVKELYIGDVATDPAFSGSYNVAGLGIGGDTAADSELIFTTGVTKQVCLKINEILKIPAVSNDAPSDPMTAGAKFTGTFVAVGNVAQKMNTSNFTGLTAGCRKNSSSPDTYGYYQVLLIR